MRLEIALLLAACTLGVRLPGAINDPLWQDEIGVERVITTPGLRAAVSQVVNRESTPPVFYLAAWALNHATRTNPSRTAPVWLLRVLPLAFSIATTVLTFVVAAELLPLWAAALAGVIVSFASELVLHGSELRAYSLLALTCVLFAFCVRRAVESPKARRLAALAGVVAVGSLTHYFFLLTLAAGVLWLLWVGLQRGVLLRVSGAIALGLVPLAAWSPYWLRQYHNGVYATSPPFALARLPQAVSGWFVPNALTGTPVRLVVLLVVLASASTLIVLRRESRLPALLVLVPVTAAIAVAAAGPRVFNTRNLIGVVPFAAICLAWACASLHWRRSGQALGVLLGALIVAGWGVGQAQLGRTGYDRIAHQITAQGFRRNEPIVWFGGYGGVLPVAFYLTSDTPADSWPRILAALPSNRSCGAVAVVARTRTGRRWLDQQRELLLRRRSLPAYGDAPQARRQPFDVIVARLHWRSGILTRAAAAGAQLFQRADATSPCLRPVQRIR